MDACAWTMAYKAFEMQSHCTNAQKASELLLHLSPSALDPQNLLVVTLTKLYQDSVGCQMCLCTL